MLSALSPMQVNRSDNKQHGIIKPRAEFFICGFTMCCCELTESKAICTKQAHKWKKLSVQGRIP